MIKIDDLQGLVVSVPIVKNVPPRARMYGLVGRGTTDKFRNKDLTDPSNILGATAMSKFTVSNGPTKAKYTTIQAAIDAATLTGRLEQVFIFPGTYPEDVVAKDRVNITGVSPDFEFTTHMVLLTGNLDLSSLTDVADVSISNISYNAAPGKQIFLIGSSPTRMLFINCTLTCATAALPTVTLNNPSAVVFLLDTLVTAAQGGVLIDCLNIVVLAFKNSILGDIFSQNLPPPMLRTSGSGVISAVVSHGYMQMELGNPISFFASSFFNGPDMPLINLIGGAQVSLNACMFISNGGSGSNFIIGNGRYIDGGVSLFGRNTVAAGVTAGPSTFPALSSGDYVPDLTEIQGIYSVQFIAAKYSRSGNNVTVFCKYSYKTDGVNDSITGISLPFPRKVFGGGPDFTDPTEIIGHGGVVPDTGPHTFSDVTAEPGTSRANVTSRTNGISTYNYCTVSFTYTCDFSF